MDGNVAIKVDKISKSFKLPKEKVSSIKGAVLNFYKPKAYDTQQVLKNVSFEIKKGEFFGIVGRNGSGKSTLLKVLAGIYSVDKGEVAIDGKLTPFIELGVGFNPELTGRENIYLNCALLGFSRKETKAMYSSIVEFAELENFMDQKLKNYSSGMQVRLAFSIAIRAESDILLIDEVLAVGDQNFQEKCFRYFAQIKKSDRTVVFVTHDMSNVERFCDRVLLLDKNSKDNGVYDVRTAVRYYNELNHETSIARIEKAGNSHTVNSDKDVYIKKVSLLANDKKEKKIFMQGDALHVRIELGINPKHKPPKHSTIVVGLAFHDNENINLAGPNSIRHPLKLSPPVIEYVLANLPFNRGEYYITVAIFDELMSRQYDIIDKGITLFVNTEEVEYGKVVLQGNWVQ